MYQVIIQDEWNNLYHIGFYKDLKDSVNDINEFISSYDVEITPEMLTTYPGTFNEVFDHSLGDLLETDEEPLSSILIRGFIFDKDLFKGGDAYGKF